MNLTKVCPCCRIEYGRRPGESASKFKKRKTCGNRDCLTEFRILKCKPTKEENSAEELEPVASNLDFSKHNIVEKKDRQMFKGTKEPSWPLTKSAIADASGG